jgi:hypothetical protein
LKEWLLRQNDKKNLITFLFFSIITNVDDLFMTELIKKGPTPGSETSSTQAKKFLASTAESSKRTLEGEGEKIVGEAGRIIEQIRAGLAGLSRNASIEYRTSDEINPAIVHGPKTSRYPVNHTVEAGSYRDLLNFCGEVSYERYAA